MITKIKISTPKGQASKTNKRLKPFLIGRKKVKLTSYVNDDDNEMYWEIEGSYRDILKIQKNVSVFDTVMYNIFNTKMVKKAVRAKLDAGQEQELKDMLFNQTSIEIIKEATAQEIVDAKKTTKWEWIKQKFKRA